MLPLVPFTASLPPDRLHWLILLSLGFYGAFGHWLLIRAYRHGDHLGAGALSLSADGVDDRLRLSVFGQFPDRWTLLGAAIIVASGLYIVHREHRLRLKSSAAPNSEDEELAKKL